MSSGMTELGESTPQPTLPVVQMLDENKNRASATGGDSDADTKENKGLKDVDGVGGDGDACFICREKNMPMPDLDCRTCQNIRAYHSKRSQSQNEFESHVTFPGPGMVKRNHIYGNYVVASRAIEEGEVIILERPMTIGPYSPPDILPLCLGCCKDIGRSTKCSICKWPVCGEACEQFFLHSENECSILAKNGLRTKVELKEYFSVETLRALLLRDRDPYSWKRILEFEPHSETRRNDYRAKENNDFIVDFIRNKCNLGEEYSPEIIEHVVGILSVNTFWAFNELQRYASCLFDKITLFAHDCDPNTERNLLFIPKESEDEEEKVASDDGGIIPDSLHKLSDIALLVRAARRIEEGEMITTRYINLDQPLLQRREELRETFYFECTCSRCLRELGQLELDTVIETKLSNINL